MRGSREMKKQRTQLKGCNAFCCSCSRLSVSSSEGVEGGSSSDRLPRISSLAHAMVQERLDQMIRERFVESRNKGRRRESRGYGDGNSGGTKCIVMVAMDKCSYDPRKDFRDSMVEMITANQIEDPKDLRSSITFSSSKLI
ncbi:hypothetical protein Syun_009872 [Stephania yunnanensis]|uniref:Transcription repressor n=1 Tax=Stephania yunnanensis TaxID=152371 RepID=A0AAP0KH01_9MAGN